MANQGLGSRFGDFGDWDCLKVQLTGVIKWDPFWGDQTRMHGNFEGISQ